MLGKGSRLWTIAKGFKVINVLKALKALTI